MARRSDRLVRARRRARRRRRPRGGRTSSCCRRRRRRGRARTRAGTRRGRGRDVRGEATAARRPWPATGSELPHGGCAARSRTPWRRGACGSRPAGTGTGAVRPVRRRGESRRAGRGSGGRSGTPCGACRRSPSTVQNVLPFVLRRPRPSCWRNRVGLSVGRSIRTVSTCGYVDTLVEQIDGEHDPHSALRPRSRRAASRSARGLSPQMATAGMPWRLKWSAMKRACSMLTQNPRARIDDDVGVLGDLMTTRRAHASELV